MTLHLSPEMEAQLEAHAAKMGMSIDEYLEALLRREMQREAVSPPPRATQFQKEHGIWVLRTGEPMPLSVVRDTRDTIRTEREARLSGNILP